MTNPAQTPRLKVEGLVKSFFGVQVLHDVSFEAHGGRVLGVVGENGSGKSTAMNLLTGVLPREASRVLLDGVPFAPRSRRASDAAGIAFIQQELNIFPNLSVAENLFLLHPPRRFAGLPLISRREVHDRARKLLGKVNLDVSPGVLAGTLSAGQRQLLEIGRALAYRAQVFIFDEPTSSLTARETGRLFDIIRRLRENNVAILYISHNLEEVLELSDDILVLRDGKVTLNRPRTGLTARDLVLAMVGRPIEALFSKSATPRAAGTPRMAAPVLEVTGLGKGSDFRDISLRVGVGKIVGLAGLMGSGRSALARTIFGLERQRSGVVRVNGNILPPGHVKARLAVGVAFLTEDRRHEGLMMDASVADNMALAALPDFASPVIGHIQQKRLLGAIGELGSRLNLKSGEPRTTPARTLSGGNQQKVVIGRWLLREPRLFILNEPTRGVDIGAKQEIYRLLEKLAEAGTAVLIVSSELEELIGLCDRIHVMRRGEMVAEFERSHFDREALLRAAFGQGYAA
jgi:ABC-type sugar transport system ATPase subunit